MERASDFKTWCGGQSAMPRRERPGNGLRDNGLVIDWDYRELTGG